MKSIFNGVISFGLVSAPFKMFSATESHDLKFNQLHGKCNTKINLQNFCSSCNTTVAYDELVKGHEVEKGKFIIITPEELKQIEEASNKTLEIVQFVDLSEVDPVYYEKSYYIGADNGGEKALSLLHQTLLETKKAALGRIIMRGREHLIVLRATKQGITGHMMLFKDEVRDNEEMIPMISFSDKEKALATSLVGQLSEPLDLSKFTDEYQVDLKALVDSKVAGSPITKAKKVAKPKVNDLMAALQASVDESKKKTTKKGKK